VMAGENAFLSPLPRSWWQRIVSRLFPSKPTPYLEDREGWAPGYICTYVDVRFDWVDRLRVLVSGKVRIVTSTRSNVNVTAIYSESAVWVEAP
jgi:hypothetical protein